MEWRLDIALDHDEDSIVALAVELSEFNRRHYPQNDDEEAVLLARAEHMRQTFRQRGASLQFWIVRDGTGQDLGYALTRIYPPHP